MSKIFNLIIYSIQLNKSIQSIDMNAELADAKLEKLLSTKQSLDRVLKGLPNKKSTKARRLKENKIKAEKRKRERLNRIQEEIKSKIIKLDSEGTDQCITKQMLQLIN